MKRYLIALLHLGYWFIVIVLAMVLVYLMGSESGVELSETLLATVLVFVLLLPALLTFYVAYFPLFSRFFNTKRYVRAYGYLLLTAVFTTFTALGLLAFVLFPECREETGGEGALGFGLIVTAFHFVGGTIAFVLRGFSNWFEQVAQREALQEQNQLMELALVKARLDPHFLFNTLNNIDVLILRDPERASAYLNDLSDIMRFVLHETQPERIPLAKEIEYIEKYVALQRIRTSNPTFAALSIHGQPADRQVAPMVFIPFIENAFKHAPNKKVDEAIRIRIDITDESVRLQCQNVIAQSPPGQQPGGLGNDLMRDRLRLLYPGTHRLVAKVVDGLYRVNLHLNY